MYQPGFDSLTNILSYAPCNETSYPYLQITPDSLFFCMVGANLIQIDCSGTKVIDTIPLGKQYEEFSAKGNYIFLYPTTKAQGFPVDVLDTLTNEIVCSVGQLSENYAEVTSAWYTGDNYIIYTAISSTEQTLTLNAIECGSTKVVTGVSVNGEEIDFLAVNASSSYLLGVQTTEYGPFELSPFTWDGSNFTIGNGFSTEVFYNLNDTHIVVQNPSGTNISLWVISPSNELVFVSELSFLVTNTQIAVIENLNQISVLTTFNDFLQYSFDLGWTYVQCANPVISLQNYSQICITPLGYFIIEQTGSIVLVPLGISTTYYNPVIYDKIYGFYSTNFTNSGSESPQCYLLEVSAQNNNITVIPFNSCGPNNATSIMIADVSSSGGNYVVSYSDFAEIVFTVNQTQLIGKGILINTGTITTLMSVDPATNLGSLMWTLSVNLFSANYYINNYTILNQQKQKFTENCIIQKLNGSFFLVGVYDNTSKGSLWTVYQLPGFQNVTTLSTPIPFENLNQVGVIGFGENSDGRLFEGLVIVDTNDIYIVNWEGGYSKIESGIGNLDVGFTIQPISQTEFILIASGQEILINQTIFSVIDWYN